MKKIIRFLTVVFVTGAFMLAVNIAEAQDKVVVVPLFGNDSLWQKIGSYIFYNAGNVGIGTASPLVPLDIAADAGGASLLVEGSTQFNSNIHGGNNGLLSLISTLPGQNNASSITFTTSDGSGQTERVRIAPDGNVGIGTISPTAGYKLDVEGKIQATSFDTGDITFRKNGEILWRMFEEEDGLYLENVKTSKVYRLVVQELEKTPISMAQLQLKNQELEKRLAGLEALIKKEQ